MRLFFLLSFLLTFSSASLVAQQFGGEEVITTSADGAHSVYATDLDGNGDVDVLSPSGVDDKIAWYGNLGNGIKGRVREEGLNQRCLADLAEARAILEDWRQNDNEVRPPSALENRTPREFAARLQGAPPLALLAGKRLPSRPQPTAFRKSGLAPSGWDQ